MYKLNIVNSLEFLSLITDHYYSWINIGVVSQTWDMGACLLCGMVE